MRSVQKNPPHNDNRAKVPALLCQGAGALLEQAQAGERMKGL